MRSAVDWKHSAMSKKRAENLLASLLWLTMAGCAATLPEFKGALLPGEELVTLATRPGVTVRILLTTPSAIPRGIFLFFPRR